MPRKKEGKVVSCLNCGKKFYIPQSWILKRGKFHSRSCYVSYLNKFLNKK